MKAPVHWFYGYLYKNYKIIGNIAVCGAKGEIETTETESAVTCRDCRFALGELKAKGWS